LGLNFRDRWGLSKGSTSKGEKKKDSKRRTYSAKLISRKGRANPPPGKIAKNYLRERLSESKRGGYRRFLGFLKRKGRHRPADWERKVGVGSFQGA